MTTKTFHHILYLTHRRPLRSSISAVTLGMSGTRLLLSKMHKVKAWIVSQNCMTLCFVLTIPTNKTTTRKCAWNTALQGRIDVWMSSLYVCGAFRCSPTTPFPQWLEQFIENLTQTPGHCEIAYAPAAGNRSALETCTSVEPKIWPIGILTCRGRRCTLFVSWKFGTQNDS